ncbi:MAG: DMT family transporter [Acidobacteria bacterium]|nr:MAG: DMT family transporter [Acidobacteriota bacterium]
MVFLLSLCSAIAYGLSDFVGGVLSRRASVWAVAATSQATAAVLALGLIATNVGEPRAGDLLWGGLAGIGSGAGNVFIYRGLAGGRMAVVAPLSALAAAGVPVLVGLFGGERPGALPMVGVLTALPAIWLVSNGGSGLRDASRADVVNGLLAGLGFGAQFSALGQVREQAGLTPLAVSQVVSVVAIVMGAVVLSGSWLPRDRFSRLGAVAGLLAGIATVCFQLAVRYGLLSLAAVVTSLYPAVTVLLAALILRERIGRAQGVGLALALMAIALIASG